VSLPGDEILMFFTILFLLFLGEFGSLTSLGCQCLKIGLSLVQIFHLLASGYSLNIRW
jgi:hypothetical protein